MLYHTNISCEFADASFECDVVKCVGTCAMMFIVCDVRCFLFECMNMCGPTSLRAYVYNTICVIFVAKPLSYAVTWHHTQWERKENWTISKASGTWESLSLPQLSWRTCGVTPLKHTHTLTPPLTLNYLAAVTTNQSNYHSKSVCRCC